MLDRGVYTLAEIARYTGLPVATLRDWFMPRSNKSGKGPIFTSAYGRTGGDFSVSFLNLIEAHVAAMFRDNGYTHARIRAAHSNLQEILEISHPFAHRAVRFDQEFDSKSNELKLKKPNIFAQRGKFAIDANTKQVMLEYVAPRLNTVTYGNDLLAESWEVDAGIIIDTWLGFGHPVVKGASVSTLILAKQFNANHQNASLVANLFRTTAEDVQRAVQYERRIGRIAA